MKIIITKYPIDLLFCLGCSLILPPLVLLDINNILRILIGLPFVLFIPGYLLLAGFFPQNNLNGGLESVEKIAFSFGLSIALIPLIGILLYYSPFGLKLESILFSIFGFIFAIGIISIYRWYKISPQKRFNISLILILPKSKTKLDRILLSILIITIIITIITAIFVAFSPIRQETSTEFYLLGSTGKTTGYPKNIITGQQANVTIGLINHEKKIMNYTVEIWLINQTITYNQSSKTNETTYHEMWFMTTMSIMLHPFPENTGVIWKPQWEQQYMFSSNKTGKYTLTFLLYPSSLQNNYNKTENYKDIAAKKIQNAYESIYLWVNIS